VVCVDGFDPEYLQQGIAAILVFIGVKMLIESYVHISIYMSLVVIVVCILVAIIASKIKNKQAVPAVSIKGEELRKR